MSNSVTVTQSQRDELVAHLTFSHDTQRSDLLNAELTTPELIMALLHECHKEAGGLLITAVRSDHEPDTCLGPHGHSAGYSVDLWPTEETRLQAFIQGLCTANPWVTRTGLGGAAQGCLVNPGDTIVFYDNSTDHIHLQTGG